MWSFKTWLNENLDALADKVFAQRSKNTKLDHSEIAQALGIKTNRPLTQINQGSLANIYKHPEDPSKVIKVTADMNDARNLIKSQRLNSPNIVKVYQSAKVGAKAYALVVDFIGGKSMPYNTNALLTLINGNHFDDTKDAISGILTPDRTRRQVLDKLGRNTEDEKQKLSRLFRTLYMLSKLGIDMDDFTDNILDGGTDYVIIDMGL